jgi:hypothetical protein
MKSSAVLRFAPFFLQAIAPVAWAQDSIASPVAATAAPSPPAQALTIMVRSGVPAVATPVSTLAQERVANVRFLREKPVLGLPLGSGLGRPRCSTDGTAFYDLTSSGSSAGQQLYSVSVDGDVMHLLRKLPMNYTDVLVRDFFAGEKQLVTLLEAVRRDDDTSPPRTTDYFLSLEDQAGDVSNLIPMSVRFEPVKVARFATGDVMVLGWDEGNLVPVLATIRGDGSIQRFVDLDALKASPLRILRESDLPQGTQQDRPNLEFLQGATFVPFGSEVLLTWPGSTKPILALGAFGDERLIPVAIPAGFVLSDVLASSGGRGTLVLRVKEADVRTQPKQDGSDEPPRMKLLEFDSFHGSLLRTISFDKPLVSDVICAPNSSLTAIFYDTIPDASQTSTSGGTVGGVASTTTQLVIATARR